MPRKKKTVATTIVKQPVPPGIRVTLNSGGSEMNSATVPVQWWLSEEVIRQDPNWILFYEQTSHEAKDAMNELFTGRRYLCRINEVIKFLQVFSPGHHRLMVVALKCSRKCAQEFLDKSGRNLYDSSMSWVDAAANSFTKSYILASTVVEFNVPPELFAERPKSKLGQAVWQWVNLCHETGPTDECAYRKRMIFAFTAQPVILAIGWFFKYGVGGTFYALYILLASLATFFAGFRPRPILKEMWQAFTYQRDEEWGVMRFENYDIPYSERYHTDSSGKEERKIFPTFRVWSVEGEYGKEKVTRMPVAPFQVIFYPLLVVTAIATVIWVVISMLYWLIPLAVFILLAWGILAWLRKKMPVWELQSTQVEALERQLLAEGMHPRQRWLLDNLSFAKVKPIVDLQHLPKPQNGGIVQSFYVGFWTLKAKVCKPFSK